MLVLVLLLVLESASIIEDEDDDEDDYEETLGEDVTMMSQVHCLDTLHAAYYPSRIADLSKDPPDDGTRSVPTTSA